jgi:tripartite-type tricarboxylate transporter receptor subunit TctC
MRFRRAILSVLIGLSLVLGVLPALSAEEYPTRRITFIVAFAPGGVADTLARVVAHGLEAKLGQSVVVENHAGAGGNLAAGMISRAAPDGYTFLITTTGLAINLTLNKRSSFTAADFKTVAMIASSPEALVVNPGNSAKTLSDFVKAHKGKPFNFGSAGVGSGSHIEAAYFFSKIADVSAVHVAYQGGAPAMNAVLGNQIDILAITLGGGAAAQIKSGKLRGLGIASDKRAAVAPDVPTYSESGFPEFSAASWVGVFAPAKTDNAIVARVNEAIEEVLKDPEVQARLTTIGFDPLYGSHLEATAYFGTEVKKWGAMVKTLGLSIN